MKNWKLILQIAATYIGTVVGAGFASGQEIMQFFTIHGRFGTIAIFFSTLLFMWMGSKLMLISQKLQCFSFKDLNLHLFGHKLGWAFNGLTLLILFGTTGVMLSGSGAIFLEQFGIPSQVGILFTVALCILVMTKGMNGIVWVNSFIVPMMLLFTFILISGFKGMTLYSVDASGESGFFWLRSAFLYVGFNLAMAQAVLVPLGKEMNSPSAIKWGAILGGLGLGVMLLVSHLALLQDFQLIHELDIPLAKIISSYGKWVVILFSVVVYGEIFTTIIGNVFGLARQLQDSLSLPPLLAASFILFGSFLLSQWGFRSLVSNLYPLFGIVGLIFMTRVALYLKKT